jgi:hypothetical protein
MGKGIHDFFVFGSEDIRMYSGKFTIYEQNLTEDIDYAADYIKNLGIKYILDEKRTYHTGDVRFENVLTKNFNNTAYFTKVFEKEEVVIYEVR